LSRGAAYFGEKRRRIVRSEIVARKKDMRPRAYLNPWWRLVLKALEVL
jgi:hypothetical protein